MDGEWGGAFGNGNLFGHIFSGRGCDMGAAHTLPCTASVSVWVHAVFVYVRLYLFIQHALVQTVCVRAVRDTRVYSCIEFYSTSHLTGGGGVGGREVG